MACGRPKNLEIAARNLLCGSRDRRRNFFTTRDGNRRRGNPEPPGKGQLRAFGQGEVRRHGEGETRKGETRATRLRENFKARGGGETPSCARRRKPWATGEGKTSRHVAEGKPRVMCGEESSEPSAKGKLEPFGMGATPVIW